MKIKANAKINLTLDMVARRDDGYHILDSVMQSVSLADIINIEKSDVICVECGEGNIDGENNIAYKAAERFFEHTSVSGGAHINIVKNIPLASGMGGGSADAAAVIVALNKLYDTRLTYQKLCEIALSVGADVPFCINGGTARVGGIGENIKQLYDLCDCGIVLIKQGQKLSTADMYRQIDQKPYNAPKTDDLINGIIQSDLKLISQNVSNAFLSVCDIDKIKEDISLTNPMAVSLSGSGPTVFALYQNLKSAKSAADSLASMGYNPITAVPEKQGLIIE